MKRLREEYWSVLFGLGTRISVSSLDPESAKKLVVEPVSGLLAYASEAVDQIIHLTAGQPFLLQCLCNRIYDNAAVLKSRAVTLDLVNRAASELIEDNEHFAFLWGYMTFDRRRLLLAILEQEMTGGKKISLGALQEMFAYYGLELNDEMLISDLEFLREIELVDLHGEKDGGHYTLTIPLMGQWISSQHDFSVLRKKALLEMEIWND